MSPVARWALGIVAAVVLTATCWGWAAQREAAGAKVTDQYARDAAQVEQHQACLRALQATEDEQIKEWGPRC